MVFEDAITRWRHSRSCRSGGFDNFVRRREIETQALQKMAETLDPDMTLGPVSLPTGEAVAGCSKELCCFICRQRFTSLDEMREHVKYPCNKPPNLQRPSMTVYIEEPTFGTGIQQHFTEGPASRASSVSTSSEVGTNGDNTPHPVAVYMSETEQAHSQGEAKPTNIYVNEKGETVIEVENLDLNTKSGELSLAHLLTQLSQQGIVFDQQTASGPDNTVAQDESSVVHSTLQEVDLGQPTAVDAANTLTQLAGSAYRAANPPQTEEIYTYEPPPKRIKTECVEVEYPAASDEMDPNTVETVLHKEGIEVSEADNYIICTNSSEVISVVRADGVVENPDESSTTADGVVLQEGSSLASECPDSQVVLSDQTGIAEHYTVSVTNQELTLNQQTFPENPAPLQTVFRKNDDSADPVQGDEREAEEYTVKTLPSLNHEEQWIEQAPEQRSNESSEAVNVLHSQTQDTSSERASETACTDHPRAEDSTQQLEQVQSSVCSDPKYGVVLPQVSVSATPEMHDSSMQQTHSAD